MVAPAPPRDFDDFKDLLATEGDRLPRRLKHVASALLTSPDDIAFSTAAQISKKIGVQPSTLVRFAQVLGLRGFSELQALFRERLRVTPLDHRVRIASLNPQGTLALFEGFAKAANKSLEQARETLDPEKVEDAVEALTHASTIYIVASGRSFPAGAYATYAFGALGLKAILVDQIGGLGKTQLSSSSSNDAVLAISFTPYAYETLGLIEIASANKTPTIAITDNVMSPLASAATIWLELSEADYASFRSLSATFALIMALSVAIAKKRGLEKANGL